MYGETLFNWLSTAMCTGITTHFRPPPSRIDFVLKLQWAPAPFQSPGIGFGSNVTMIPKSSATRCSRNLDIHRWSPMVIPSHGPTWNSPCGTTNTLVKCPLHRMRACVVHVCCDNVWVLACNSLLLWHLLVVLCDTGHIFTFTFSCEYKQKLNNFFILNLISFGGSHASYCLSWSILKVADIVTTMLLWFV